MLHKLAIEAITRSYFSSFRTGIVIAGFGEGENCPSLERFEMEGIINGRLKYVDGPAIDIGRKGPYADVIGFAQRDMIDRFLHGVDPEMYTYVGQLITNSIEYTAREIVAGITNVPSQSVIIPRSLALVIKKIQDDQVKNLLSYK